MLQLEDFISKLGNCFEGIERYNNAIIVKVIFPTTWKAFGSPDEKIRMAKSETKAGEYFFYADSADTDLETIFKFILELVDMNQGMMLKNELFKSKVEELKELFVEKSYDELQKLHFSFEKKRVYKKKKKVEEPKKEETTGEDKECQQ